MKLTSSSSLQQVALLQQRLEHLDEVKQAWHNGTKCRAYHHDHFDILFTQIGLARKKLKPHENSNILSNFWDLVILKTEKNEQASNN